VRCKKLLTAETGIVTKGLHVSQAWTDSLVRPKQGKRDIRFGTWNVRSLNRAGSLTAAAGELARYKLELVGVREVRWGKGGTVRGGDYVFYEK
jgi:hypothetical protein